MDVHRESDLNVDRSTVVDKAVELERGGSVAEVSVGKGDVVRLERAE